MTKDKLIKEIIDGNKKTTRALVGIEGALEKINDNNVLHSESFTQAIQGNTQAFNNNAQALRLLCEKNKAADWTIKTIIILLLLAIIVLAGAKQAVELFPNVFGFIK